MAAAGSSSLVCRRSSPNSRVEELYRAEQVDEATMAAAGWSPAPPDGRGRTSAPPPPQVSCSGRVRHAPPPSTQIEVVGRAWSSAPTRGRRGTTGWRKLRRRPVSLSAATAAGGPSRARALKAAVAARHLRRCAHTLEVAAAPCFAVRAEEVTTSGPTGSSHSHLRGSAPSCCRLRWIATRG
jgi:hypothetical protein